MDKMLLTAKDIAQEPGIAESTIRYWRDKYEAFIPHTSKGKRRRYPQEAVPYLTPLHQSFFVEPGGDMAV